MELALRGRKAVVTGGPLGIGFAIAAEPARQGAAVAIIARDPARLGRAAERIRAEGGSTAVPIAADLTDADAADAAVRRAEAELGGVDILVNNAGATPMGRIGDTPDAVWMEAAGLKPMGHVRCARVPTPPMRRRRWGRVVNLIGRSGHQPRANHIAGSAVNASLLAFTHALARECAPDNVLVAGVN